MITELQKQKRRLHAQIAEAFDAVPYPGNGNLCDGSQRDDDYEDVVRRFTGKQWRELIPERKPPQGRSHPMEKDLCFCSAAAWHFFLPSYLITSLMMGRIDSFQLEPPSGLAPNRAAACYECLSAEQCIAVVSFLDYADVLLVEKQRKMPQHRRYFEARRRELVPAVTYWNNRVEQQ